MNPSYVDSLLKSWGIEQQALRGVLLIFAVVFCTALVAYIANRLAQILADKAAGSRNLWDDTLIEATRKPGVALIWLVGLYGAAEVAYRYSGAEIFTRNNEALQVGIVWVLSWTAIRFIRGVEQILVSPDKVRRPMDYTTVSALGKITRAAVIITAILVIMQTLGYSISGVLAFGGVGGLAVGFAAKDLLANFFGGLMVFTNRPFKVGEWIRSPDRGIEGTVEHIGWYLTRIRTFDQRPLYVPNATFSSIAVENPSRMTNRRIFETIGLRYADIGHMASIVAEVKEMLKNRDDIDITKTLMVNFTTFNASSVDFFIYAFTRTTQWPEYHEVKQDVLLKTVDIITRHGAEIAFPTRTLHIAGDGEALVEQPSASGAETGETERPEQTGQQEPS